LFNHDDQLLTKEPLGLDEGKQYASQVLGLTSELAPEQAVEETDRKY